MGKAAQRCRDELCVRPWENRGLQVQTRQFESESASSGGRIVDETLTGSEFWKAVQCATHSANEGQHCQLQQRLGLVDYQRLQGRDIGA